MKGQEADSILLEHLSSWFGISSTVFSWVKSFYHIPNIENSKSSVVLLVLGPLLIHHSSQYCHT